MTNHFELAKVEDEAATWAVLLADDPDNHEQLRQFRAWLSASAFHADVWTRTCRAYEGLGRLPSATQAQWPEEVSDECRQSCSGKRANKLNMLPGDPGVERCTNRVSMRSLTWKNSLAIAACLVLVFLPHLTLRLSADYVTATGEQQTYVLQDGSTLILAPESAIDIRYSEGERQVRLLRGAAFFDVKHDIERPFIVQSGDTRTTVLGTAFNVDMTDSGTVVSVAHGRVRVEDKSVTPMVSKNLTAGDHLAVAWGEGARLTHAGPDDIARWRRGELVARDLPVSKVVDSFRRYYGGVILVTEPFASQRVTGLYRLNDPASTLADMAEAHGATARQISPWLLVLSQ
jgi:transmembrane sensor